MFAEVTNSTPTDYIFLRPAIITLSVEHIKISILDWNAYYWFPYLAMCNGSLNRGMNTFTCKANDLTQWWPTWWLILSNLRWYRINWSQFLTSLYAPVKCIVIIVILISHQLFHTSLCTIKVTPYIIFYILLLHNYTFRLAPQWC